MFSDELIVGIATCVTTIIATAFTIRTNKLHPIDEERYKKVLFPIMCILQAEDFRFNSIEKSTAAILKIKTILKNNRYLAGEIISQYIFEFENASCLKHQRRAFCFLCEYILKSFQLYPCSDLPIEIKSIGSSLLGACQGIEDLRSRKTKFHGKTENDYIIQDSLYAYFVVNATATIGLFLKKYFEMKFPLSPPSAIPNYGDDLPF